MKINKLIAISFMSLGLTTASYGFDPVSEIENCSAIGDDQARLQCYDALGTALKQAQAGGTVTAPASDVAESESSTEMSDSLGGGRFASEAQGDEPLAEGRVTFCQKSYDGKWLFVFANGQIWKQVRTKKRRFKDCDFAATIEKDFFGYFLKPVDSSEKTRIERLK